MKRYADHGRYLLPFLLFLILSSSALAQSPSETTIAVEGQITNGTTGAPVPANLPLMLHTYEGETMTAMTDGTSDSRGRFLFENVAAAPGRAFEATVTYQDVSYFSPLLVPAQGQGALELPVQIYETGSDLAALQVEQDHVLLDFSPGAMQVSQVYILSNYGDRMVVGNEGTAPLRFSLPAGATDLSFDGDPEGTRFVRLEDGFADRAPVRPGRATHQIVVGYILPYDGQLQVELPVDYSTAGVNVLLPDVGVTLSGAGLGPAEERLVQGQRYLIYRGASLPAGGSLTLELSGQPGTTLSAPTPVEATASRGRLPVLLGGVALSLILIAAGILWWWRERLSAQPELILSAPSDGLEALIQAIADLDDAREAGAVEEEAYREKRTRLRTQAVALLAERRQAT